MRTRRLALIGLCLVTAISAASCGGSGAAPSPDVPLENVLLTAPLDFELASLLGTRVWALGIYNGPLSTGAVEGYLLARADLVQRDEQLPAHTFARLNGMLPPDSEEGAELIVYGMVKDYATETGASVLAPTALITVEKYKVVTPAGTADDVNDDFAGASKPQVVPTQPTPPPLPDVGPVGTAPGPCDRALILSGGIDANNNHARYKQNIERAVSKLKALGFSNAQIEVLYDNGTAIDVGGTNAVDGKATKAAVQAAIAKFLAEMAPSCTLTVFITDHGTGFNPADGWHGARLATAREPGGKTYAETSFKIDLRKKVYRGNVWTNPAGVVWAVLEDKATGKLQLYKKVGGSWVLRGSDANGDGRLNETETGQDISGNGSLTDFGWNAADLGAWRHKKNEWDTDHDGTKDVRARWDAGNNRYVFERLVGGVWKEMAHDTNGDFIIDATDGGVDWNLDGDTGDMVGFHEGINLWGHEVLWDDELADLLGQVTDAGMHVLVEMVQCYGGGFIENLKGKVEKVVVSSAEDRPHVNRKGTSGAWEALDWKAFLDWLAGIDIASWNFAADQAQIADEAAWTDAGSKAKDRNDHARWEKPVFQTDSTYTESGGVYVLTLKLPPTFPAQVFDMEIIFGLQKPRWASGSAPVLPAGYQVNAIPGGLRITHQNGQFPLNPTTGETFGFQGAQNATEFRVQLTDQLHKAIGYILPMKVP